MCLVCVEGAGLGRGGERENMSKRTQPEEVLTAPIDNVQWIGKSLQMVSRHLLCPFRRIVEYQYSAIKQNCENDKVVKVII